MGKQLFILSECPLSPLSFVPVLMMYASLPQSARRYPESSVLFYYSSWLTNPCPCPFTAVRSTDVAVSQVGWVLL